MATEVSPAAAAAPAISAAPLVLLTDSRYSDGSTEAAILAGAGATLLVRDCATEEELIDGGREAAALLVTYTPVTGRVMEALSNLRLVIRCGIGTDNIDLAAARARDIRVANVPDYCIDEVADHTLTLLLACERRLGVLLDATRVGGWPTGSGLPAIAGLRDAVLGVVGLGHIGRAVSSRAFSFGMRVLAYDPFISSATQDVPGGVVHIVGMDEVLGGADFVSLHLPLTAATEHMIDTAALRKMKRSAYLINTSRGAIVDSTALRNALTKGWIAGAALDVLEHEPDGVAEMSALPGVLITPHVAWYSRRSLEQLRQHSAQEIVRFLRGEALENPVA